MDKYQQEVLRTIINDETIKDVFFQGMNFEIIVCIKLIKAKFVTEVLTYFDVYSLCNTWWLYLNKVFYFQCISRYLRCLKKFGSWF